MENSMAYERKNQNELSAEQIKAYDLYLGYTALDIKRRFRVSNKVARQIWKAVADEFGTLNLCKDMVKREKVFEFLERDNSFQYKYKPYKSKVKENSYVKERM